MAFIGVQPATVPLTSSDITDGIISTAKIADDAVGNTKLDLSANYAFTGNVSGVSDLVSLANTTISSSTSSVTASSSIINSTYDTYYVQFQFDSVSDGDQLHGRFLQDGSNVFGSNYQYELSAGGSSTYNGTNSDTHFEFDIGTNGNAAGEGPGGYLWIYNINNNDFPAAFAGMLNDHNSSGNHTGNSIFGTLKPANKADTVNGFKMFFGSNNIARGYFRVWGLKT